MRQASRFLVLASTTGHGKVARADASLDAGGPRDEAIVFLLLGGTLIAVGLCRRWIARVRDRSARLRD